MARLHHVAEGPDNAPAVVLGPSLGTELALFEPQAAALAERYRVIRFDLRGHGGSEVPPGPYSVQGLAEDVLALLDELGVRQFSYIGVSLGGAIGQWLSVYTPERLHKLVILASAAQFPDPDSWVTRAETVRSQGTEFLVPSRTGAWFTGAFARERPDTSHWLLGMLRRTPWEGYAGCCEAISTYNVQEQLPQVTAPTLVIAGAQDPATPVATCRAIADAIPAAELLVVPDTSHLLNIEAPAIVNEAIGTHLATRTGAAPHR